MELNLYLGPSSRLHTVKLLWPRTSASHSINKRGGRALNVGQAGHAQGVVVDGICCGYVVNGWMGALTAKALSVGNSDKVTTYGFKVSG